MKLTIDHTKCDLNSDVRIPIAYDAEQLRSPAKARQGRSATLTLPQSATNDRIFESIPIFNAELHSAELTHNGAQILQGTVRLLAVSQNQYTVEIRSGGAAWARQAALQSLADIPLEFTGYLTPADISNGWSDTRPVKLLPVLRDTYEQHNNSSDLQPVFKNFSPDDCHPFVHLEPLLRALFHTSGYDIESRFMESELFRSLYISGAFPSRDTVAVERRIGFHAVRLTTASAVADAVGRVYATPYGGTHMIGNIVESATPFIADEQDTPRAEAYNNGNCFGFDNQQIVYRPTVNVSAGFEYRLRYTTQHRILTRKRLAGFDTLNLGTGGNISFELPNRYADRRGTLAPRTTYRAVVFTGTAGSQYRLSYTYNGAMGTVWTEFTGRSAQVTTPASGSFTNPALFIRSGTNAWSLWQGDWALYDGFIGETGETTVELNLRTPAQQVGPTTPKYFNTIFFGGAEQGMRLTLHTECAVRPVFSNTPAYGARITAVDVLPGNIRQQVLLEAVQHLFNLRFFTDEQSRKVYIEPEAEFQSGMRTADWSGRTDLTEEVVWEDVALGAHDSRTYGYLSGDGAATRLGTQEGKPFGAWQAQTKSYAAIEGDQKRINPLFCPTVNTAAGYPGAPSAQIMQVGDRDDPADNGDLTPRIIRYCGLKTLPAGESWGSPSEPTKYPFAAFHFAGDSQVPGFTLCFGDRNAQQGLHRFYDREEAVTATRRHVTLTLRLEAHEYENLFTMDTDAPDLRNTFRITTDMGMVKATLRRIERYDPQKASARCTFTLTEND